MKAYLGALLMGAMTLWGVGVRADTHYVAQNGQTETAPYTNGWGSAASNIQDAVTAAANGDTVLVGAGRYVTPPNGGIVNDGTNNVVYINKLITLRSSNGVPESTVIDGGGTNRVIDLAYGTSDAINRFVLDGITVSNGYSTGSGGGIYVTSPGAWTAVIQNCRITHCTQASGTGAGGMFVNNVGTKAATFMISNTVFRSNQGGGFYIRQSPALATARISSCRFEDNTAFGLYSYGATNLAENTVFRGNTTSGNYGSAVQAFGSTTLLLRNCLIDNNYFGGSFGGAVDLIGNPRVDQGFLQVDMGCYEYLLPGGTLIMAR